MRTSFILASVGLVAVLGLAGCAADNEPEGGNVANVPHSAPGQTDAPQTEEERIAHANPSYPSVPSGEAGFTCRAGAFCETFDNAGYANNWSTTITTGKGELEQLSESASLGTGSLRLTTRDEASTAFLLRETGAVADTWNGSLGFAIRVPSLPSSYLGGPELTVKTPLGPVYVRLVVTPDGLWLEQNGTASCPADRCVSSRTFISTALPNHWYNVVVGFEVNARNSAPYGLIETSVNGGDFTTSDLNVPLSQGPVFLKAGITQGDVGAYGSIDLDNVSLLVR